MIRHFLELGDAGGDAIAAMIGDAIDRKDARVRYRKGRVDDDRPLDGAVLAMVFEKNSTRTRASFDLAMRQLGGSAMVLDAASTQLGRGESVEDTARVLSRYADAIMVRTDDHAKVEAMAAAASVPVINGLTDASHPCQIVSDLLTLTEHHLPLPGLEVAWFGDGNNVCNSWIDAAGLMRFNLRVACPEGYDPDPARVALAQSYGARVDVLRDARAAAAGADVLVTDCWVSMGQGDADRRLADMTPFRVDEALLASAKPGAPFLHCLPAHRGEEMSAGVIDGPQSLVWDEAENRVHAQKSILRWVFGQI